MTAREIQPGDELQLDGTTWRITQTVGGVYAGPVEANGTVRYDRAINDPDAWRAEYDQQHG